MTFHEINVENIGKEVTLDGYVTTVSPIEPRVKVAVFECRSCLRIHEVEQNLSDIREPYVCKECGGKRFKLLRNECEYIDRQIVWFREMETEGREIELRLYGETCTELLYPSMRLVIKGMLQVELAKRNYYYIDVVEIRIA